MQEQLSTSGSFVKLSNSRAKAGPMSAAIAVGLTCPSFINKGRLDLDHFESQSDSPRLNQRLPTFFRVISDGWFIPVGSNSFDQ